MNIAIAAAPRLSSPLTLTQRIDGPWLAIPAGRAPGLWRSVDAEAPLITGGVAAQPLVPLSDFGVGVSLYPHSRVISLVRRGRSCANVRGVTLLWAVRVSRLRVARTLWPLITEAAKACNLALMARGLPHV